MTEIMNVKIKIACTFTRFKVGGRNVKTLKNFVIFALEYIEFIF